MLICIDLSNSQLEPLSFKPSTRVDFFFSKTKVKQPILKNLRSLYTTQSQFSLCLQNKLHLETKLHTHLDVHKELDLYIHKYIMLCTKQIKKIYFSSTFVDQSKTKTTQVDLSTTTFEQSRKILKRLMRQHRRNQQIAGARIIKNQRS